MLRAREPRLLNAERAERMISSESFEAAAKLLTELGYEDMSGMSAGEIGDTLNRRRAGLFSEMERLCPDREITDVFRIKYDYHNLKVILKAEASGTDAEGLFSGAGRISPAELREMYHGEKYSLMPGNLGKAAEEAKSVLARTGNPQQADFILDKAYFSELLESAENSGNDFLKGYVAVLADTVNLKSIVRTMRMGKSADFLEDALVPGGGVPVSGILSSDSTEEMLARFSGKALETACEKGAEALSGGRLTEFELACDNAVNAYVRRASQFTYGSEPVTAFLAAAENEITAVRMILTGKLAGIRSDVLRERLRDLYA